MCSKPAHAALAAAPTHTACITLHTTGGAGARQATGGQGGDRGGREEGGSTNGIVQGEVRRGEERGGDAKRSWVDSDILRIVSFQSKQNATEPCTKPKPKTKQGWEHASQEVRCVCWVGQQVSRPPPPTLWVGGWTTLSEERWAMLGFLIPRVVSK